MINYFARFLVVLTFAVSAIVGAFPAPARAAQDASPALLAGSALDAVAVQPQLAEDRIEEIQSSEPTFSDDFSADSQVWDTLYDGDTSRYFKSGTYHISVDVADMVAWGEGDLPVSDLLLEVETTHWSGPLNNEFGVVFRQLDGDNFYYFAVSSDGFYSFKKLVDGEWENIINWTESDEIETGEGSVNWVSVLAEGPQITLLVNDVVLDQVEDDTFESGNVALAAGTFDEPAVDVIFDDLSLAGLQPIAEETPEPAPNRDATPTPTPQPSLSVQSQLEEVRATYPTYSENFRRNTGAWSTEATDEATLDYVQQAFQIEISEPNWLAWSTLDQELSDFLVEVEVTREAGPTGAEYGPLFRVVDDDNFYFFAIDSNGYFSLWKKINDEWAAVVDWTFSDEIATEEGETNILGVMAQGPHIALIINDVVVAEADDDSLTAGQLALAAGTFEDGGIQVAFDNLDLWGLQPTTDAAPGPEQPTTETPSLEAVTARVAAITATEPSFSDSFRRNADAWTMESDDNASYTYAGRSLHVRAEQPNWLVWSTTEQDLGDFLLAADVTKVAGADDSEFGLVFRFVDGDNFYLYRINGLGSYSLWKKVDGEWQMLIDWTSSEAIATEAEAVNRLGVLAEGESISVIANDEVLAQVEDDSHASGLVGMVVGTVEEPGAEAAFDNVEAWSVSP